MFFLLQGSHDEKPATPSRISPAGLQLTRLFLPIQIHNLDPLAVNERMKKDDY